MALVLKDRVVESSTSSGTGTFTLNGAETGYQSFSVIGNGNTTYYTIEHPQTGEWEVGVGTYNAGTLSRDTVLSSSNSGALVYFSSGQKNVFCDLPAEKVSPSDTLGTMAYQNANAVAVTGGTVNGTTIGATTASTGKFTSVTTPSVTATTGDLNLTPIGSGQLYLNQSQTGAFGTVIARDVGASNQSARLFFDSSAGVSSIRNNGGNLLTFATAATISSASGTTQFVTAHTASAVNYVQVTGAATGNLPAISSQGSDASISMSYIAKGSNGFHFFYGSSAPQFAVVPTTSAVNYGTIKGAITAQVPSYSVAGSDTNISMAFQPKGTGAIDLAAGSSGVNISNGGTVTAITRTGAGVGYTTAPTWSASAPTTAGSVTATGTTTLLLYSPVINNGGTGYTIGDTLTVVGGTFSPNAATITVSTVSAGVITSVAISAGGTYTATPTYPASVTGGTGSGATFTLSAGINTLTIGNAGSGYIEQPTVTFSGGGGSGASAYASVGGATIVRSLGTNIDFYVPSSISSASPALRITDGGSSTIYPQINNFGSTVNILAAGATNTQLLLGSGGTSPIAFTTNSTSRVEQLRVSHTASAVNYVNVTGAATGNAPTISMQGSDANIPLAINAKGTSAIRLGSNNTDYLAINTNTATLPILQAIGGSANISIQLLPKGTGTVSFGTYTASILTPTGYITITDSGGTTRRLLVG